MLSQGHDLGALEQNWTINWLLLNKNQKVEANFTAFTFSMPRYPYVSIRSGNNKTKMEVRGELVWFN